MFRIKDKTFNVKKARVGAEIRELATAKMMWGESSNGLAWNFEVSGEPTDATSEDWEPRAYCEYLALKIVNWTNLEGVSVDWKDAFNKETQTYDAGFYVFEHEAVHDCQVSFGERQGNRFAFQWQGLCDIYADEDHMKDVPFHIETDILFTGIRVYAPNARAADQMLARFFDPLDFVADATDTATVLFEPRA